MKIGFFAVVVLVAAITITVLTSSGQQTKPRSESRTFAAPDGGALAVVVPVSKEAGRAEYESRIEFHAGDGKLLCALNYSSEDSEHGYGVVKAAWTPDSQYFVYSMTSSGGHQAWHAPTQFYSRKTETVRTLDDYLGGSGITNADFKLFAPNTVKTEILKNEAVPASVKLDALSMDVHRRGKPFSVACSGGRVHNVDQP